MTKPEPSWPHMVSEWWLIMWRGAIGAALGSFGIGLTFGLLGALGGASRDDVNTLSMIAGALLGAILGLVTVRMALRKHDQSFHFTIVPR